MHAWIEHLAQWNTLDALALWFELGGKPGENLCCCNGVFAPIYSWLCRGSLKASWAYIENWFGLFNWANFFGNIVVKGLAQSNFGGLASHHSGLVEWIGKEAIHGACEKHRRSGCMSPLYGDRKICSNGQMAIYKDLKSFFTWVMALT